MKKPALLLCAILTLLVFPAHAAMIVNDHFDGNDLSSSWNVTMSPNTTVWNYDVQDSKLKVNQIGYGSNREYGTVILSKSFKAINDFSTEFSFNWEEPNTYTIQTFGIDLFDSNHNRLAGIFFHDAWLDGYPQKAILFDRSTEHHGSLPLNGSGTASMVREDGIVNYYWNGNLLASKQLLEQAASLELQFNYHPWYGQSPMGTMNVDYVTLEGNPVDLSATPEPGTMVLLGSALGLGVWWQRRRRRNKRIQA